jgi:hypothetical protein
MSGHCPMLGGLYVPGGQRTVEPRRRIRRALTAIGAHQDVVDIVEAALLQIEEESWHRGREQGLREGQAAGREQLGREIMDMAKSWAQPGQDLQPAGYVRQRRNPTDLARMEQELKQAQADLAHREDRLEQLEKDFAQADYRITA